VWDIFTLEIVNLDSDEGWAAVTAVAFSPDGKLVAVGYGDEQGTVRLFDAATGERMYSWAEHGGAVTAVAFSPEGRLLASASGEEVKVWATSTWEEKATLPRGAGGPLAFHPDRALLAVATSEGKAEVWSLETFEPVAVTGLVGVVSVAFSPDGIVLATGRTDGSVLLWDLGALGGR